jgi:hypothetical protein
MPDRPRVALPLGAGIDRHAGSYIAQAGSFADLRNVRLGDGKILPRFSLDVALTLATAGSVIGIYPVRSSGVAVALVYSTVAPIRVEAWQINGTGTAAVLIGDVWTYAGLPARIPRAIAADSYDKLVIAHDLESYSQRKITRVYDFNTGLITDLATGDPGMVTVKFRGVARHLNYIFGWGYGTDATPDRPEIVRVSLPGDPTTFDINHYFVMGQRGDPVLSCQTAGDVLLSMKYSETYDIFGYDRATFGYKPGDMLHGIVSPRAGLTIERVNYRWSHAGPRRASGAGPSEDIGRDLDLAGPLPEANAAAVGSIANYTFTAYDPFTQELTWVFNTQWGYTLHLAELPDVKWSYREFTPILRSAGLIYDTSV